MPNRTDCDGQLKGLMRQIFSTDYSDKSGVWIDYGSGAARGRIDGTIAGRIAVEIETRTDKQIRGAVLDLICHTFPQKLLIIVPIHMTNEIRTVTTCRNILVRFLPAASFRVVLFEKERFFDDVRQAARELGWTPGVNLPQHSVR